MQPHPIAADRILDPGRAGTVRRLDCRLYNGCLDVALIEGWDGFACTFCRAYVAPTIVELRADMVAIAEMIEQPVNSEPALTRRLRVLQGGRAA